MVRLNSFGLLLHFSTVLSAAYSRKPRLPIQLVTRAASSHRTDKASSPQHGPLRVAALTLCSPGTAHRSGRPSSSSPARPCFPSGQKDRTAAKKELPVESRTLTRGESRPGRARIARRRAGKSASEHKQRQVQILPSRHQPRYLRPLFPLAVSINAQVSDWLSGSGAAARLPRSDASLPW